MGKSKYSEDLVDRICERISKSSLGLNAICEMEGTTAVAFYRWMETKPETRNKYARAKEEQAHYLVEEILDIADDCSKDMQMSKDGAVSIDYENIQRSKLRIDSRKWVASKLLPKKYGDKLDLTSDGNQLASPQIIVKVNDGDDRD